MNDVLKSLKNDLTSRRMLPALALVLAAIVAAGAYAMLGGSSSPSAPVASVPAPSTSSSGAAGSGSIALATAAPADPTAADSETTSGARYQHQGGAHNPFVALPGLAVKKTTTVTKVTSAKGASGSGSSTTQTGTGTKGSGGTTPTNPAPTTPAPTKPAKPQVSYRVAVQFGPAATTPGGAPQLNTYAGIQRLTPLPSSSTAIVVFTGVSASGKGATFALMQEVILKGNAGCLPSASQCQVIDLAPGVTEELEYLAPDGATTVYLLKVVSIVKQTGSAVTARVADRESKAGSALLRHYAPPVLAELRYSPLQGVVVYTAHRHH
jgi:hypothetical protein